MASVTTVTGSVAADSLGFTLMHEHLFLNLMTDSWTLNNLLNDPELTELEVRRFKDAGGVTLVDQTNRGLEQDPLAVKAIAERTGLNVVLGCGWYREPYYQPYLYRAKTDQIAEEIVRDVTEGIDGTGVRAGIIGEIGAHFTWVSPVEERMFRAAARAHKKTGVTITTHSTIKPVGLDQLDILAEEGVDLRRVVIGHAHSYPHFAYHAEIARRGAYISFDRMGTTVPFILQRNVRMIREILDAGLIRHLLLSHDVCYRSDYVTYGGSGYDFISTRLPGILREVGVSDEQFHQIMVENPRRALTGEG